jgi:hypothetical protein
MVLIGSYFSQTRTERLKKMFYFYKEDALNSILFFLLNNYLIDVND